MSTQAQRKPGSERGAGADRQYSYDIHGLLVVRSAVRLRELDHFAVPAADRSPDIEIRIGSVGGGPRTRTRVSLAHGTLLFEEHLGRLGANVSVEMGEPVRITATPLMGKSPHVLYTNVLEAVIRYFLVSRDLLLLHTATIILDGRGVMMTAFTDTGKTGTVLRLTRERKAKFLSDDMTIVDRTAFARSFPKPMTISAHTLRAVEQTPMDRVQKAKLAVQSRIHSKGGRSFGQRLAEMNVPIVSINSLAQMIVPPPKHEILSLVDCEIAESVQIEELFVLARGPYKNEVLGVDEAVEVLLENTEDAYQFPPSLHIFPALTFNGQDYDALRQRERGLLAEAVSGLRIRRLTRDDFTWADDVPVMASELRLEPRGTVPD